MRVCVRVCVCVCVCVCVRVRVCVYGRGGARLLCLYLNNPCSGSFLLSAHKANNDINTYFNVTIMVSLVTATVSSQDFFPVNFLRNVALDNAATKYVFLTDIDFEPMPGLDLRLQEYIDAGFLQEKTVSPSCRQIAANKIQHHGQMFTKRLTKF